MQDSGCVSWEGYQSPNIFFWAEKHLLDAVKKKKCLCQLHLYVGVKILRGVKFKCEKIHCRAEGEEMQTNGGDASETVGKRHQICKRDCPWKLALSDATANSVCVESHFESAALQICLIITVLCCPLFLKFDFFQISKYIKVYHSFVVAVFLSFNYF